MKLLILIGIIFGIFFSCSKPVFQTRNYKCLKSKFVQVNPGNSNLSFDSNYIVNVNFELSNELKKVKFSDSDFKNLEMELNNNYMFIYEEDTRKFLAGGFSVNLDTLYYSYNFNLSPATYSNLSCKCYVK